MMPTCTQGRKPLRPMASEVFVVVRFRLMASDFLLLRQKKVTKEKATPEVTVSVLRTETSLRCSRASAAAELALCEGSDSPRRLPLSPLCFSASPTGNGTHPLLVNTAK